MCENIIPTAVPWERIAGGKWLVQNAFKAHEVNDEINCGRENTQSRGACLYKTSPIE